MAKRKKIGLALSGGAVLGAAHVGVLKALEEARIEIAFIAGTSIGAFIGALYAFGKNCDEIGEIAAELQWMDITKVRLSGYGLLSNEKICQVMEAQIGEMQLEDAKIPITMVAADVCAGEKVVLSRGSVARAVMASTAVPGIFVPVEIDGKLLVDGGIMENLPIPTVRAMGAEFIIGVDLGAKQVYEPPTNIFGVLLNSFHFIMRNSARLQTAGVDLLLEPELNGFSPSDTSKVAELIAKGYEAACAALTDSDLLDC